MPDVELKNEILRIELADEWTLDELNNFIESFIYLYDFYLLIDSAKRELHQLEESEKQYRGKAIDKELLNRFVKKNIVNVTDKVNMIDPYGSNDFYSYAASRANYRFESIEEDHPDEKDKSENYYLKAGRRITPRINKIIINSPGTLDVLGLGKVFEVLKDWYTEIRRLKVEERNQVIDEIKETQIILEEIGIDSAQIQRIILGKMLNEKVIVGSQLAPKIKEMYLVDEEDQGGKEEPELIDV